MRRIKKNLKLWKLNCQASKLKSQMLFPRLFRRSKLWVNPSVKSTVALPSLTTKRSFLS
jgi:hypothetical protein